MVGILLESKFSESLWCKTIYDSLTERLRQKRIPFCEIFDTINIAFDTVFIIASDPEWTTSAITQLNENGIQPIIICGQNEEFSGCVYSCVCLDINASIKNLSNTLKLMNKNRIALYGINKNSVSDMNLISGFFGWESNNLNILNVFNNNGSLQNCFDDFFAQINEFDAVICANDYAAISLVRNLEEKAPKKLEEFYIMSCGESQIFNYYRNHILSLNMNTEQYGKAAVYIYNALKKHPYISGMTVRILWELDDIDSIARPQNVHLKLNPSKDSFYEDEEIAEMIIIDKFLKSADDETKKIIDLLLNKKTIPQIAELCFLTVGGVNYKINKIINDCGAKNKEELFSLLKKYIHR